MADDWVELDGLVQELLSAGDHRVEVADGHWLVAALAPSLRGERLVLGDRVRVRVARYDPTRGLIVRRATS